MMSRMLRGLAAFCEWAKLPIGRISWSAASEHRRLPLPVALPLPDSNHKNENAMPFSSSLSRETLAIEGLSESGFAHNDISEESLEEDTLLTRIPEPPAHSEDTAPAKSSPLLKPIRMTASIPSDRVAAVTAELDFCVEKILRKAMAEQNAPTAEQTLVMVGTRVESEWGEGARGLQ